MTVHDAVQKAHEQEAAERAHLRGQLKTARKLLIRAISDCAGMPGSLCEDIEEFLRLTR